MKKVHLAPYREYVKGVGINDHQTMSATNNFGFITGSKLERSTFHICFASMYNNKGQKPWEYVLLQINDKQAYDNGSNKDVLHTYYEWLLNLSLFRSSFVSKNVSRLMKDRVLVINPDIDAKIVINGMAAARMAWERGSWPTFSRIKIWYEMVNMGIDPAQAFSLCSCLVEKDGAYTMMTESNHEVLKSKSEVAHLNFLQQELNLEGESFKSVGGYRTIDSLFKANRSNSFSLWDFIDERWAKKEISDVVWGVPTMIAKPINKDVFLDMLKDISIDYQSKLKELGINV